MPQPLRFILKPMDSSTLYHYNTKTRHQKDCLVFLCGIPSSSLEEAGVRGRAPGWKYE